MFNKGRNIKKLVVVIVFFLIFPILMTGIAHAVTLGNPFPVAATAGQELALGGAFDGTNYLVGIQGDATQGNKITAQLISQSGTLVGSRISVGRTGSTPFVAFDGTNYLMVWFDDATSDGPVYGVFISKSGSVVNTPFVIAPGPLSAKRDFAGIAFGGGKYMVVYYKTDPGALKDIVYGRLVDPSGTIGNEIIISTGYGKHTFNNVAFDGTNFFVVWDNHANPTEVKGRFVNPSGTLGTEITVKAANSLPSDKPLTVAFDGTNYLVVWTDQVSGNNWDVFGQLVTPAGTLSGGKISISTAPGQQSMPLIAFDGTNYLISWTDMRNDANGNLVCDAGEGTCMDIYGQFVSKSGALVGSEFIINNDVGNQMGGFAGQAVNGRLLGMINTGVTISSGNPLGGDVYSLFTSVSAVNSADYFPLSVGNRWVYFPSFGTNGNRVDSITGEESINGIHTYIWNRQEAPDDNYNEKIWIAKDDSGVKAYKFWSNEGPDPAIIMNPPWLLFESNPIVGDTFIGEFDLYPGIHLKITSTIESVRETVTVPAGTFTNCVIIREKNEITQNSITTVKWRKNWFAPNIGRVIHAKYNANWGSATTTQQLISFSVSGVQTWTVTPSAGAGGTITPSTAQTVNHGSTTSFVVTPNSGYTASVGGTCGGSLSGTTYTTNPVTGNCTVSATFTANPVNGACGTSNGQAFASAPTANLCSLGTPTVVSGSGPWTWSCAGSGGGTTADCTAANILLNLIVAKSGTGNGTVSSAPAGINCGADCSENYSSSTSVILDASPAAGSAFTGWSGACTNTTGTCTVTMDASKNVTATFTDTTPPVVSASGSPSSPTASTSATLTVSSTDVVAYKYKLDNDPYSAETNPSTPITLSSLSEGSHTISIIGKDVAGNWQSEGSATTYTWIVTSYGGKDTWTQKTDFGGTARYGAVGFSIGSKGYIGTGDDGPSFKGDFWEYDPVANIWTQKADFGGIVRSAAVGFSIGGKGYIGTGNDENAATKEFWEYDPTADTWTRKADFGGAARSNAVGFSIGSKGYIGTGYDSSSLRKDFWEYDPVANTWTQKADFGGTARYIAVGFSIGSKGYIGTGMDASSAIKDFWEYDPVADTWTQKADFGGTAQHSADGFSMGSKGYIGTGLDGSSFKKDFWEYDPATDTWTQKADFGGTARANTVSFSIGSKGYMGTGHGIDGTDSPYKDFWEYDPELPTTSGGCGTANGQAFTSAPTANLCSVGTPTSVVGSGPWTWSCAGSGGGTNDSCLANIIIQPWKEDFSTSVLDSASWQAVSGLGSHSLTDNPGYLRYYLTGSRAYSGSWAGGVASGWSPSLTLIRPFTGDHWVLKAKANYNIRWQGTGAQYQVFYLAFGDDGKHYLRISRGTDQWYNANVLTAELVIDGQSVASNNTLRAPNDIVVNDWLNFTYWYEIDRRGQCMTFRYSDDGINYKTVFSSSLATSSATQRIILDANVYTTAGSYTDWDYLQVDPIAIPTLGDVNGDGTVNLADAILALKVMAGMNNPDGIATNYPTCGADVNCDGKVGLAETIYILKKIAGLRIEVPATYSISGTITAGGVALSGATITLSGASSATVVTDANGNYTFTGLANGSYTITPSEAGYTFTAQQVAVSGGNAVQDINGTLSTVPAEMVLIPAGSFQMGDPIDGISDAMPVHTVTLSAFSLDKYEVTKALWDGVYTWATVHGYSFDGAGSGTAANHPVQTVTWYDVVKWLNARSEKEGRTPVYYTDAGQTAIYRTGRVAVAAGAVKWSAKGYRLPTEAEWEYAARGGTTTRFYTGDCISTDQANFGGSPWAGCPAGQNRGGTTAVGSFAANPWGLYDMAGNVWEWTWDFYGNYSSSAATNPRGNDSGMGRVLRGGNRDSGAGGLRSAIRVSTPPSDWSVNVGFRSALSQP